MRLETPVFTGNRLQVIDTGNPQVLGYVRIHDHHRALIFANFGDEEQSLSGNLARLYGLGYSFTNLLTGKTQPLTDIRLEPCGFVCLSA
jgi:amylosucrase